MLRLEVVLRFVHWNDLTRCHSIRRARQMMNERDTGRGRFEPLAPEYSPDLFAGTAQFYARYRVAYPDHLLEDLCSRAEVSGGGRLLDLASGPGRLALPLSSRFSEVLAVDQEVDMVEVGQQEARRLGIDNVRWEVCRAEDLKLAANSIELITIGEAFHRLHQSTIAALALRWLKPGCRVATLGCYGVTRGQEPWQQILRDFLRTWTARDMKPRGASESRGRYGGLVHDGQVLRQAGFREVETHEFSYPHEWTADSIIGVLYSGSGNLKKRLGDESTRFEAELKDLLSSHDPRGVFEEVMRFGYTLATNPR